MAVMTGGEAIVKTLAREGARVVFGLPGRPALRHHLRPARRARHALHHLPPRGGHQLHGRRIRPGGRRHRRRPRGAGARTPERLLRPQHRLLRVVARPHDRGRDSAPPDRQEDRRPARAGRPAPGHGGREQVAGEHPRRRRRAAPRPRGVRPAPQRPAAAGHRRHAVGRDGGGGRGAAGRGRPRGAPPPRRRPTSTARRSSCWPPGGPSSSPAEASTSRAPTRRWPPWPSISRPAWPPRPRARAR